MLSLPFPPLTVAICRAFHSKVGVLHRLTAGREQIAANTDERLAESPATGVLSHLFFFYSIALIISDTSAVINYCHHDWFYVWGCYITCLLHNKGSCFFTLYKFFFIFIKVHTVVCFWFKKVCSARLVRLDVFAGVSACRPQRSCKQAVRQTAAVVQLPVSPKNCLQRGNRYNTHTKVVQRGFHSRTRRSQMFHRSWLSGNDFSSAQEVHSKVD